MLARCSMLMNVQNWHLRAAPWPACARLRPTEVGFRPKIRQAWRDANVPNRT
jgi:hypothetical protein